MTKVLGVMPSSTDVVWALVEGDKDTAKVVPLETDRQAMNLKDNEAEKLMNFKNTFKEHLNDCSPDKVVVQAAGKSTYGNTSTDRIKYEATVQMACAELGIPVQISKMKIKDRLKKFKNKNGELKDAINDGAEFTSAKREEAAFVAKEHL